MTALLRQHRSSAPTQPSLRRLLGGALVGGVAAIAFSMAVGSFVVGSTHRLQAATSAEAGSLVAAVPSFVILGVVHLAIAAAIVRGGRRLRGAATIATVLAAILAVGSSAMLKSGIDPSGGPRAGHPTTQGVAALLLAAVVYAVAAGVARPTAAEA
jgi:drug/metabolite transporter (DMT)-like permease